MKYKVVIQIKLDSFKLIGSALWKVKITLKLKLMSHVIV